MNLNGPKFTQIGHQIAARSATRAPQHASRTDASTPEYGARDMSSLGVPLQEFWVALARFLWLLCGPLVRQLLLNSYSFLLNSYSTQFLLLLISLLFLRTLTQLLSRCPKHLARDPARTAQESRKRSTTLTQLLLRSYATLAQFLVNSCTTFVEFLLGSCWGSCAGYA